MEQYDVPEMRPQIEDAAPAGEEMLDRRRLDALTEARLWRNPCGFAARFNYLALRYNVPLYGWVKERFDLSRIEFVVIYNLAVAGPFTASEIASSTAFPKNTLSRAVNRLLKLGLIHAEANGGDRRAKILSLTPAGRAIYDEALPRFEGLEKEMLAPLNLVEREMLSMLLAKVVVSMFKADASEGAADLAEVD
ncbi:MAG: MarR family transcriptional regulator [Proteobacteria bacterium]|nr:MarR family transcriptional regulator [Pseudomonadota bacterium]